MRERKSRGAWERSGITITGGAGDYGGTTVAVRLSRCARGELSLHHLGHGCDQPLYLFPTRGSYGTIIDLMGAVAVAMRYSERR